jgi:formylmethanofuran dehydrogenase subunit A
LTHIQFHSYGGGEADENTFNSKVAPLAEYVNANRNITVDVGQVLFGQRLCLQTREPRRSRGVETAAGRERTRDR